MESTDQGSVSHWLHLLRLPPRSEMMLSFDSKWNVSQSVTGRFILHWPIVLQMKRWF